MELSLTKSFQKVYGNSCISAIISSEDWSIIYVTLKVTEMEISTELFNQQETERHIDQYNNEYQDLDKIWLKQ